MQDGTIWTSWLKSWQNPMWIFPGRFVLIFSPNTEPHLLGPSTYLSPSSPSSTCLPMWPTWPSSAHPLCSPATQSPSHSPIACLGCLLQSCLLSLPSVLWEGFLSTLWPARGSALSGQGMGLYHFMSRRENICWLCRHFPDFLSLVTANQLTPAPALVFLGALSLVYLTTSDVYRYTFSTFQKVAYCCYLAGW